MNILLTGGTGFIGSHLLRALLKKDYSVTLLKRNSSDTWRIKDVLGSVTCIDIDKVSSISSIFTEHNIDTIIHLAGAYIKHHTSEQDIKKLNEANINFPAKLLDYAVKNGVQYVINTGTFFEYARSNDKISESSTIEPYNYYAATKVAFEEILKYYTSHHNLKAVTLKLFSPYGAKDNNKVIPLIIDSLFNNSPLNLTEKDQKLSFTSIEDIVAAYLKVITFLQSTAYKQYEAFNIGSSKSYSVQKIAEYLIDINNKKNTSIHWPIKSEQNDKNTSVMCNSTKAQNMLGWKTKIDIKEGLKRTYNLYCTT
jgi:nucleoside-diphosphate-sugar epimerase